MNEISLLINKKIKKVQLLLGDNLCLCLKVKTVKKKVD